MQLSGGWAKKGSTNFNGDEIDICSAEKQSKETRLKENQLLLAALLNRFAMEREIVWAVSRHDAVVVVASGD